jgi:apolipoprotein N-acyltransferase
MLWAVLPPLDLWPLAWIAPIGWLWLIRGNLPLRGSLYRVIWCAGFLHWLAVTHWLRLPHWATSFGWVAAAAYLAFYPTLFVALSRVAVHQWRWPLWVAAPITWTGIELLRGHMLGGFTMGSLGHTQYRWIELIQVADLGGAYLLSGVIMLVASALTMMLPMEPDQQRWRFKPLVPAALTMAAVLGYGYFRLAGDPLSGPVTTVALIQGSIDSELNYDPQRNQRAFAQYLDLSRQAVAENPGIELIVWPETMFREPLVELTEDAASPPGSEWTIEDLRHGAQRSRRQLARLAQSLDRPLLVGLDYLLYGPGTVKSYNSAAYVSREGEVLARYDKMHPVMFGEYVPLADSIPGLYRLTPLTGGIAAGQQSVSFSTGAALVSVSICYENILPHLIRRQVRESAAKGRRPTVLVNLTNDGWFWGSSELDLHLMSAVFRSVECRTPMLIAANTGFSAWIDADGRIRARGPRRETGIIMAEVQADDRDSLYLGWGDLLAWIALAVCLALAVSGWRRRRSVKTQRAPAL